MKKLLVTVAVVAIAACIVAEAAPAYRTEPTAAKGCTNGVSDRINGRVLCIHIGGKCVAAHNARYRARGYTCVNGRLRRVRKVAISIGDTSGAEGNSGTTTLSVPVTLSAAGTSIVVVDYATADGTATAGSDYATARGTLTFRPGEREKTVPISVLGDVSIEANETFTVTLSNPVNASIAQGTATATIANDDTAVPVTPGSYQGATQNGNFVVFTLMANRTITGFRVNDLPERRRVDEPLYEGHWFLRQSDNDQRHDPREGRAQLQRHPLPVHLGRDPVVRDAPELKRRRQRSRLGADAGCVLPLTADDRLPDREGDRIFARRDRRQPR
jgi:Calx-beta domain